MAVLLLDGKPLIDQPRDVRLPAPQPGTVYRDLATENWRDAWILRGSILANAVDGLVVWGLIERAEAWLRGHSTEHPRWREASYRKLRRYGELGLIQAHIARAEMAAWHHCCGAYVALQYVAGRERLELELFGHSNVVYPKKNPPVALWDLLNLGRPAPGHWPPSASVGSAECEWSVEFGRWGYRTPRWLRADMQAVVDRNREDGMA